MIDNVSATSLFSRHSALTSHLSAALTDHHAPHYRWKIIKFKIQVKYEKIKY